MRQRSEKAKAAWDRRRAANEGGRRSVRDDAKLMFARHWFAGEANE
jgi:hypothetical protein